MARPLGVHGGRGAGPAHVPPAPPGAAAPGPGSATVRRVTTSDEPVATVVSVPPVEAEPGVAAESPAEEAPAGEPAAEAARCPMLVEAEPA